MRNFLMPALALSLVVSGCSSSRQSATTQAPKSTVMTIGNKPVTAEEFAYVYNKNNSAAENAYTEQSLKEYLDLYTNFKLKVTEAEKRGLDTTAAFRKELDGYKQQLAQPYLTEKSVTDLLVREAYERMQKEVNASHILISVPADAEPKDTLAAHTRITKLRARAVAGEDFGKLARENSEDPSAKENSGNLGYFTALQMVYPFEDMAYKTPVGNISNPVRTRFGYHVIRVNDIRPAQGEIKVAHIMVRATPGQAKEDSLAAKKKIDEIHSLLQKGESWDKLVSQFSEDAGSVANNGELPWFGTGRMIPTFEEAAFALKKPGDVSKPVKTPYGWHLIKLNDRKTLPSFAEVEASLKAKVAKDSRSELNKAAFIKRVKAENNFTEFAGTQQLAFSKADSSLIKGTWTFDANDKKLSAPLFKLQDKLFTVKDFYTYAKANQRARKAGSPQAAMRSLYDRWVEESITNFEKANLDTKYQDYRMLVKEYRDGILLFQLMDEKVWSKAIEDTTGLRQFFNTNRDKYQWDTRAEATVISAASKNLLNQAVQQMQTGRYEYRKEKPETIAFDANKGTLAPGNNSALDKLMQLMRNDTTMTVEIIGSTDSREGASKKSTLATQRASSVAAYLTARGIDQSRVTTKTEPAPAARKGETEATRKQARAARINLYSGRLATLEDNLNKGNPLNVKVTPRRKYQREENKLVDAVEWKPGTYTFEQEGRHVYVQIHQVEPPKPKTLSEARGLATSDYQAYLEKQWLEELRQKYPVKVNQAEINKLVRR